MKTTIKEMLLKVERSDQNPLLASEVMEEFLDAIRDHSQRKGDFGQNEGERRIYRMASLGAIRNLFSEPGLTEVLAEIDPDDCVNAALLENASRKWIKPAYRIKRPFCNDRYTHKFVEEWYAERRYAIGSYGSIVVQLPKEAARNPKPANWFQRAIGRLLSQGVITDFLVLFLLAIAIVFRAWLFYPALALVTLGIGLILCVFLHGPHRLKALVPRLASCAIVGLVPPLVTKDVWNFSFYLWNNQPLFWSLVVSLFFASWLYLFIETHNHVGKGWLSACRAFHILLRLCNFALFFSWWATMFISTIVPFVRGKPAVAEVNMMSLPIIVPIPTCILFAVFAVFIGIFLQILWHDRPITSRL